MGHGTARGASNTHAPVMPISSFSTVPPSVVGCTNLLLMVRGREPTPLICVIGLMRSSSILHHAGTYAVGNWSSHARTQHPSPLRHA